jgi:hypothetical protein
MTVRRAVKEGSCLATGFAFWPLFVVTRLTRVRASRKVVRNFQFVRLLADRPFRVSSRTTNGFVRITFQVFLQVTFRQSHPPER